MGMLVLVIRHYHICLLISFPFIIDFYRDHRSRTRSRSRDRERDRDRDSRASSGRGDRDRDRRRDRSSSHDRWDRVRTERKMRRINGWDLLPHMMTPDMVALASVLPAIDPATNTFVTNTQNTLHHVVQQHGLIPQVLPGASIHNANMQATRHARRIYVGNIADGTDETEIKNFFNYCIEQCLPIHGNIPGGPVSTVYLNREKKFSFVELKTIEICSACFDLENIPFKGQPVKIKRPNDYKPELVPGNLVIPKMDLTLIGINPADLAAIGQSQQQTAGHSSAPYVRKIGDCIVGQKIADVEGKVFIGGLPYQLTEEQVKDVLEVFGPLAQLHLIKEAHMPTSKGYAFCVFRDKDNAAKCIAGLHNFALGDKTLTVKPCGNNGPGGDDGSQAPPVMHNAMASMNLNIMGGHQPMVPAALPQAPLAAVVPTRVLSLLNMVTADDLNDDEAYEEIQEDIKEECTLHGTVKKVVIPRGEGVSGVGKVFVEFDTPEQCSAASRALSGRKFAGNIVVCTFFSESEFLSGRLI
jgi:splicing factor U2AF subunit